MTAPIVLESPVETDPDDNTFHLVCCDPDRALCGTDVSTAVMCDYDPAQHLRCVVCWEMNGLRCPKCGR